MYQNIEWRLSLTLTLGAENVWSCFKVNHHVKRLMVYKIKAHFL